MIKRTALTVVTIFAGVAVGVLLAVAGHGDSLAAAEPPPSVSSSSVAADGNDEIIMPPEPNTKVRQSGYFIKEYNGRVSVLKDGQEVPEMIFDIQTKLLPEIDRKQLAQGIYVETYEELVKLVEDYIS